MYASCAVRRSVLTVVLFCLATLAIAQLPQQEIDAINAFRATIDPEPSQWATITDPCALQGIFCNDTAGALHVISVDLASFNVPTTMKVAIGSWIGSLPYLTILRLNSVNFTAPISNSLATLTDFRSFEISEGINVQLPTSLPASLTLLYIEDCDVKKMPNLVGTSVAYLRVVACPNLVDTIPAHYATLSTLKNINFESLPGLTGSIPTFTGSLYSLSILNTGISGQIPSISAFQSFTLINNALTGTIPSSIFTSTVSSISLGRNQLTGTIPSQISAATSLQSLNVPQNRLTGPIPQSLLNLPSLLSLDLGSNNFSGNIPDFGQLNALLDLDLSNNQFTGSVPVFLAPKLRIVDLSGNQLSSISAEALAVQSIENMNLQYNKLTGTIPQIGRYLNSLNLDGNQLTGSVPFTDGLSLVSLALSYNQLTGSIPIIGSSIIYFTAAGNQLTGFLPTIVSTNLIYLDLSNNQLYGEIPAVYKTIDLLSLDLSNNLFSGCFNGSFPRLRGCSLSKNFFCCVPEQCQVADIDCPNCPLPSPEESALCQYDTSRRPTWVVVKDLVINDPITFSNTVIYGDLDVNSNISISGGVIDVKGCADIEGSLTVKLTPEEIAQLANNGTLTRDVIRFNSTCSTANLDFDSVSYEGDLPCTNTTIVQKNTANSITVIITSEKIPCPGDLAPWAIGVIVAACVVAAGAAIGIGLGVTKKQREREETRVRSRLSSSIPPQPQRVTNSTVELEAEQP